MRKDKGKVLLHIIDLQLLGSDAAGREIHCFEALDDCCGTGFDEAWKESNADLSVVVVLVWLFVRPRRPPTMQLRVSKETEYFKFHSHRVRSDIMISGRKGSETILQVGDSVHIHAKLHI